MAAPIAFRFSKDVAHIPLAPRAPAPEPLVASAVERLAVAAAVPRAADEKKQRIVAPLTNAERLARSVNEELPTGI